MAKTTGLAKAQQSALAALSSVPGFELLYLAGGTAIAWHLGHRRSRDLDFFSFDDDFDLLAMRRRIERAKVRLEVVAQGESSLKAKLGAVPVDIVRYPYPLLEQPMSGPEGCPIAQLNDLGAMKLAAVSSRGIYRDFWDLYEIATRARSLSQLIAAHRKRFGLAEPDPYHLVRALTYFEDAERVRRLPAGLTPKKWEEIKAYFRAEAPALIRRPRRV
jgi:hypothetical protein